jgi:PP-loop superfamily ATP-utilizing enzyme
VDGSNLDDLKDHRPGLKAVNPVPRTYACLCSGKQVRGFGALPLQGGRNIHPRAYARGVLWYGVKEWRIRHPLVEAQMAKEETRHYSRDLGLPSWNKPALACLSSRFPYGMEITWKGWEK